MTTTATRCEKILGVPCTFRRKVAMDKTLQHELKTSAKPKGNKETQELTPLQKGMQLITREAEFKDSKLGKCCNYWEEAL